MKTSQNPYDPNDPALSYVPAHAAPVEDEGEGEALAEDEGGEGDEDRGCSVVGCLEQEDRADYA